MKNKKNGKKKKDPRTERVQPIRLSSKFFPLDIHKSMFINDLAITIPSYYVKNWGESTNSKNNDVNKSWGVDITYISPKDMGRKTYNFKATLFLSSIRGRSKESSYRIRWNKDFAVQLAKDFPKSFVRSLEFHIGDEYYKLKKFTEYDIGGFKEQVQVKIYWDNEKPQVLIRELFKVREESQGFPNIFKELSSYLIADYLLSNESEILRNIQVGVWKSRENMKKEMNENIIYFLLNRESKKLYIGETSKSLSQRYPEGQEHHSFIDWTEYTIIQLPPETSDHTRLLIERILIALGAKLFKNNITDETPVIQLENVLKLMNKKK
jgi:hypothetical protein